jgi:hypothetical protein
VFRQLRNAPSSLYSSHLCSFSIPKVQLVPWVLATTLQQCRLPLSPRSGARGVAGQAPVSRRAEARPWPVSWVVLMTMQWLHVVLRRVGPVAWRRLGDDAMAAYRVAPRRANGLAASWRWCDGRTSCCAAFGQWPGGVLGPLGRRAWGGSAGCRSAPARDDGEGERAGGGRGGSGVCPGDGRLGLGATVEGLDERV